uniref:Uncharacterized protein n=1 Tax=Arundo donax TaxID=35708 RepID=A0A0A9FL61_ARUDO
MKNRYRTNAKACKYINELRQVTQEHIKYLKIRPSIHSIP